MESDSSARRPGKIRLGVNIDHVATLRQARYRTDPFSGLAEPCPVGAALAAEAAGAEGITAHLRQDRRHIQDRDIDSLRTHISTKLNLEMGNTPEILAIALRVRPDDVCLVPESREEVTTEGGLDCAGQTGTLRPTIHQLQSAGIVVSLFIDPDPVQIAAAAALGAEFVELHTGAFANATGEASRHELDRLIEGARRAHDAGLRVNAGHGINYRNLAAVLEIPHLVELNIGHSIVSRAMVVGMKAAVAEMLELLP